MEKWEYKIFRDMLSFTTIDKEMELEGTLIEDTPTEKKLNKLG